MNDDELRHLLRETEERIIGRVNQQAERVLNRITAAETDLRNLRTEHGATRDLVAALPATVLHAIEKPLQ